MDKEKLEFLQNKAKDIRKITIEMIGRLGSGHVGGSLSIVDLLTDIYYNAGNVDPKNPGDPDRDRIVISKGHAGPGLYAVLASKGYFPMEEIKTLNKGGTHLPSHCDMNKTVGVDMTAGSLGQGLSCAIGMALAGKLDKKNYRVYCVIGDGESQEGQVWEAAMFAAHYKLDNLCIIVDINGLQIDGRTCDVMNTEPVDAKFAAFGCDVVKVNGHDFQELEDAFAKFHANHGTGKPTAILMKTTKGKGVSYMENQAGWHGKAPNDQEYEQAMGELKAQLAEVEGM